jgi:MFS family permease
MSSSITTEMPVSVPGFLSKERIIARPGFNRWLVPPAALAIHLCIGMAYGFSVFWLPLSKPWASPRRWPARRTWASSPACSAPNATGRSPCWLDLHPVLRLPRLLGRGLGGWLEHAGPRKAGLVSALCWCGGLLISAIGVNTHQIWLMWLGSGVIGGIGLGLGYISPVSTLIKWFPDKRGMATGMAIMGFGGGAMVGAAGDRADGPFRQRH